MTYPTPDANGTIAWNDAVMFAWESDKAVFSRFAADYGHLYDERIDLGELMAWHSDVVMGAIADLVFS